MLVQEDNFSSKVQRAINRLSIWFSQWGTSKMWWAVFIAGAIFYGLTAQSSVSWQDCGRFQWRILTGDYFWPEGVAANAHPMFVVIGKIVQQIPIGDVLWRLSWASGLGMAVALANFAVVVTLLTGRRWVAILFTAILGLAHANWWLATIAQTYTWNLAGMTLELWLMINLVKKPSWWIVTALAFVNGFTLSIHGQALLIFPIDAALALYLIYKKKLPVWSLGTASVAYVVGATMFIVMIVKLAVSSGSIGFAIYDAFIGVGAQMLSNTKLVTGYTIPNAEISSLSFVNILFPLALVGWFKFRKLLGNIVALAFGALTLIDLIWWIHLDTPEIFTYMIPVLAMIALAAAVGASYLIEFSSAWRRTVVVLGLASLVCMPTVYGTLPNILRGIGVEVHRTRMLPFRDEMRYWITPWKQNEKSAQLFGEAALKQAAPNGIILTDMTPFSVLQVVQSMNSDFQGIGIRFDQWPESVLPRYDKNPEKFRQLLGDRPLYIVSPIPGQGYIPGDEGILHDAEVQKQPGEVLYRVTWKNVLLDVGRQQHLLPSGKN